MIQMTDDKREEAIADCRVERSQLADMYPCPECRGEGRYLVQNEIDDEEWQTCDKCGGEGCEAFAEYAADVDAFLVRRGLTVSTRCERELRELLIDVLNGNDDFIGSRTPPDTNPVLPEVTRQELEHAVEMLFDDCYQFTLITERDLPGNHFAGAFGRISSVVSRIVVASGVHGRALVACVRDEADAMAQRVRTARKAQREAQAGQADYGVSRDSGEGGSAVSPVSSRTGVVESGRHVEFADGVRTADDSDESDNRSGDLKSS